LSTPPVLRLLLSRKEAAEALGMSLRHFQRHVQPHVRCIYSGQLRLYRLRDLERWAEERASGDGEAA
jgi:hypothetical protein